MRAYVGLRLTSAALPTLISYVMLYYVIYCWQHCFLVSLSCYWLC